MASSNQATSPSTLANGSLNLLANEMQDLDKAENLERQWLKVRMTNHLRLMQDNQRLLDTSVAEDRALRQQRHRFREAQLAQQGVPGSTQLTFPEESSMGDIKIDSPETHNHYSQAPAQPRSSMAPWLTAGAATVLAAALGGSYLGALLNKPTLAQPPTPINTKVETKEGFLIELVPPKQ